MSTPVHDEPGLVRSGSGAVLVRSSPSSMNAAKAIRRTREDRKRIDRLESDKADLVRRIASLEQLIMGNNR